MYIDTMKKNVVQTTTGGACMATCAEWLGLMFKSPREDRWLFLANKYSDDESSNTDDDSLCYYSNDYFRSRAARSSALHRMKNLNKSLLNGNLTLINSIANKYRLSVNHPYLPWETFLSNETKSLNFLLLSHKLKSSGITFSIDQQGILENSVHNYLFQNPMSKGYILYLFYKNGGAHCIAFYAAEKLTRGLPDYNNYLIAFDPNVGEFVVDYSTLGYWLRRDVINPTNISNIFGTYIASI